VNLFTADNFSKRRTTEHNLYDPESLLTGAEMARGLDYDCPRLFIDEETYINCCTGKIPVDAIPEVAPRVRKYVMDELTGLRRRV
jgi:hypothetical protein